MRVGTARLVNGHPNPPIGVLVVHGRALCKRKRLTPKDGLKREETRQEKKQKQERKKVLGAADAD